MSVGAEFEFNVISLNDLLDTLAKIKLEIQSYDIRFGHD